MQKYTIFLIPKKKIVFIHPLYCNFTHWRLSALAAFSLPSPYFLPTSPYPARRM